jgi:hypothetical protein
MRSSVPGGSALRRRLIFALVAGALIAPALAAPTCLLEIDRQRYSSGLCEMKVGPGEIMIRQPGGGEAVTVRVDAIDSSRGFAVWNGRGGTGRPDEWLGPVERDGEFCWRGSRVRLCAWGP